MSGELESGPTEAAHRRRSRARFAAVAFGVLVVGLAGYTGFVQFAGSDRSVGAGIMVLGAATGFAAFFSPCSFPLLLTFLARRAADSPRNAVASAFTMGAGVTVLLGLLGSIITVSGGALGSVVAFDSGSGRAFRVAVGLLLVGFGLRQTRWVVLRMAWLDRVAATAGRVFDPSRSSSRAGGDVLYGFGYLLAGFG
ncbi:MAG: hypothetical protein ACE5GC_07365 [Acidimicrobiia bacterium]